VASVAAFSPRLAAWAVERAWFTPPRPRIPSKARILLGVCRPLHLDVSGRRVAAWVAGAGPLIALVHGWGGYGAQLGPFVEPLVDAGFRVALFDAPGHGASAASPLGLRQGSFQDFARALEAVASAFGPLFGIVAHSGGAIATGLALRGGLSVERLALLAPAAAPARYAERFDRALGIQPSVGERWRARAERRVGIRLLDLDLVPIARQLSVPPTLLVHDRGDREVPFSESEAIVAAWPRATLVPTESLGHHRILRDPAVIDQVTSFLAAVKQAPAAA
jgi:pimeloyl-ACP methyl ester carboxylesterase